MTRDLMTSLHRAMAGDSEGGDLASLQRMGAHLLRCYEASRDQAVFAWYSQVSCLKLFRDPLLCSLSKSE